MHLGKSAGGPSGQDAVPTGRWISEWQKRAIRTCRTAYQPRLVHY